MIGTAALVACGGGGGTSAGPDSASVASQVGAMGSKPILASLALQSPERSIDSRLANVKGPVEVWVSLADQSLAAYKSEKLAAKGFATQVRTLSKPSAEEAATEDALKSDLRGQRDLLASKQNGMMSQLSAFGAEELGRVHVAHNAIAVRVNASQLKNIAAMSGVVAVRPVINYNMSLAETVPYVGAAAAQAQGKDGRGVRVAVIDSGVDYTHYNLGGAGTEAAYAAAYGASPDDPANTTRDGLFPTAKVVDGYDFVGEAWPFDVRTEDPDPIDFQSHGTHVADIIAGHSTDGQHVGVAPGASLVAIKVCSSVATACSGVALLKGIDFALDPNGDGDISDAVDVINMSLGSDYGLQEDDLYLASQNAVNLGVVVCAAAGNAANRPYIVSSPSVAPGVISVAQTAVPSDTAVPLLVNTPAAIAGVYANTQQVDWAPIGAGVTGDVIAIGRGCPAESIGPGSPDDPYTGNPAGKIALIDRGACAVSLKVDRAAKAGAIGVLIGLVASGDAVSFSFGGGAMFVPTLVIQRTLSLAIKGQLATGVNVTLSSANAVALVGSLASTSARGPSTSLQAIKPEIGAPGASVSAVVGSGTGQEAFGGTSGATPMVSGAAAILLQAFPARSPAQIKALLMNSAETAVYTNTALAPGLLAPITRIGAGELRVNRALALSGAARNVAAGTAALSFGYQAVTGRLSLEKTLRVENFSSREKRYTVRGSFRYANDEASGAVTLQMPATLSVSANGHENLEVKLRVDGSKLPDWTLDGGPNGGNGATLDLPEYDGYITLTAGTETLSVPWHILPRKAAAVSASGAERAGERLTLRNAGATVGDFDVFSLTGVSPRASSASLPQPGDNFEFIDLRAVGVGLPVPGILQFAINTFGRRSHPNYPAEFDIVIDTNRDGTPDFVVYNSELGTFGSSGQNVVHVFDLTAGTDNIYFYTDADLDSANAIFTVPSAALGITDDTAIDFNVYAVDNYFTGASTDSFGTMTYTPSKPRFVATGVAAGVPAHGALQLGTARVTGGAAASPSQLGLLLMYRLGAGREADIVRLR
jgi:minor extracellular serine protease Vpr